MDVIFKIRQCAMERDWNQFHTPRNLTMAIMGEVGELADLFQFKGDYYVQKQTCTTGCTKNLDDETLHMFHHTGLPQEGWTAEKIDKVHQEIADVAIYSLRLVDVIGIQEKVSLLVKG